MKIPVVVTLKCITMFSNSQETLLRISQNGELCVTENIINHYTFKFKTMGYR
jgi:hypothetical protein